MNIKIFPVFYVSYIMMLSAITAVHLLNKMSKIQNILLQQAVPHSVNVWCNAQFIFLHKRWKSMCWYTFQGLPICKRWLMQLKVLFSHIIYEYSTTRFIRIPVTDGKKMPMRMVKDVVISAKTWLYTGRSSGSISSGSLDCAMNWPISRKLSWMLSEIQ